MFPSSPASRICALRASSSAGSVNSSSGTRLRRSEPIKSRVPAGIAWEGRRSPARARRPHWFQEGDPVPTARLEARSRHVSGHVNCRCSWKTRTSLGNLARLAPETAHAPVPTSSASPPRNIRVCARARKRQRDCLIRKCCESFRPALQNMARPVIQRTRAKLWPRRWIGTRPPPGAYPI